ncbi:ABC transporter permease [Pseudaeromonas sp. ZJS20]|uniref:ABC transporter permease n=1 Tax=Pseudaeromonas aegiceratis TaxID=3153928 RepID=UPI00390C981D
MKICSPVRRALCSLGGRCALPVYLLLLLGFAAPLIAVLGFSFATPRSFDLFTSFSWDNYLEMLQGSVWKSYAWSLCLAALATASLAVICYPVAVGMVRVFGPRLSSLISVLFVFPLFVSENVRLYGWVLFFMKHGVLDGLAKLMGGQGPEVLFTGQITLFGLIYTFLPYMLFPLVLGIALLPQDLLTAARDLGASRWQTWREVELPLAMPGMLIGMLLTFVLATGSLSEAKILGGQSIIVITHDIDTAFTYSQNWPFGSALAVVLTLVIGVLTLLAFTRLDLDKVLGRK